MRLLLALTLLAAPALAPPALAEDAPNLDPAAPAQPGAVALYVQAAGLYALGQAAKDPLMVLTAARMRRGLALTDTARSPDPAPEQAPAVLALDPAAMLEMARLVDAGDNFTDLIESVAKETPPQPRALRATAADLAPGASQTWTLPFFGGTYAEVAIMGRRTTNLDLLVSDDKGTQICNDRGSADVALCGFTPAENGSFTVTVTNVGGAQDAYILLTN